MNTFALMLLAFPFYLTVKGRLIAYTSLATTSASTNTQPTGSGAVNVLQPLTTTATTPTG